MDDLFFVDVGLWQEALEGLRLLSGYGSDPDPSYLRGALWICGASVLVGYDGAALYAELKVAISRLPIPSRIAPLTWHC